MINLVKIEEEDMEQVKRLGIEAVKVTWARADK
jgi:hypothetical protein